MGAGASRRKKAPQLRANLIGVLAVPRAVQKWKRKALRDRTDHDLAEEIMPSVGVAPPEAVLVHTPNQVM